MEIRSIRTESRDLGPAANRGLEVPDWSTSSGMLAADVVTSRWYSPEEPEGTTILVGSGRLAGKRGRLTGAQHQFELSLDGVTEIGGDQRLGGHHDPLEVLEAADFETCGAEFTQQHHRCRRSASDATSENATITPGHVQVGHDEIETASREFTPGRGAGGGGDEPASEPAHHVDDRLNVLAVVVGDEQGWSGSIPHAVEFPCPRLRCPIIQRGIAAGIPASTSVEGASTRETAIFNEFFGFSRVGTPGGVRPRGRDR